MAKKETLDAYMRISSRVKEALDAVRGSVSASDYIDWMMTSLNNLGIEPLCDTIKHQDETSTILKRIEDVIKIIRSIEQNSLNPLLKNISKEPNIDEEVATLEIIKKNEDLESSLGNLRREKGKLIDQVREYEKAIKNIKSMISRQCDRKNFKKSFISKKYEVHSSFFDDIKKIVDYDIKKIVDI